MIIEVKLAAHLTGGAWVRCTWLYRHVTPVTGVALLTLAQKIGNLVDTLSVHAHGVIFTLVDFALTPVSSDARHAGARSHSLRARAVSTRWAGTC